MHATNQVRAYALRIWVIVGCVCCSISAATSFVDTDGYFNCKCIKTELEMYAANSSQCTNPSWPLAASDGHCYPKGFGSGTCQKWGKSETSSCLGSDPPPWCDDSWCYVSNDCQLMQYRTTLFVNARHLNYSYATCGKLSDLRTATYLSALEGKSIRIHTLHEPPLVYRDRPVDHPVGQGALIDFFTEMALEAGFTFVETPLRPYNGSSYDACARDVGWGALDLCMGSFWQTPERMEISTFLDPLGVDNFMLVTSLKEEDVNFGDYLGGVFKPFTGRVWLSMVGIMIFVATLIFLLERRGAGPDHPDFQTRNCISGVAESTYLSCMGFWSAAPEHHPTTPSGRLMLLAFAVFVMLTVSGYTAGLASSMIVKNTPQARVSDVDGLIKEAQTVCMTTSVMNTILFSKPLLNVVPVPSQQETFQYMENGQCDAIIEGNDFAKRMLGQKGHCRKTLVGEVIQSVMLSQPVNPRIAKDLAYWMVKLRSEDVLRRFLLRYSFPDQCEAERDDVAKHDPDQLDLKDFVGSYSIVGFVAVCSISYRVCMHSLTRRGSSHDPSKEGDLVEVLGNMSWRQGETDAADVQNSHTDSVGPSA